MAKKDQGVLTGEPVTYPIPSSVGAVQLETFIPWTLVKRGVRREVITPLDAPEQFEVEATVAQQEHEAAQDTPLVRALGLAYYWQQLLDSGKFRSITQIAAAEGIDRGQATRIAQLSRLAPSIIEACMANKAIRLTLEKLTKCSSLTSWNKQQSTFDVELGN